MLTLESGDIFSCGTAAASASASTFLAPGDVMETEIEKLGKMRNRFVEEAA